MRTRAVSVEEGQTGGGETGTYTVELASEPVGGDVTVTPSSADEQAATVSGALTFTAGNWNTAQTVTLTGVEDSDARDETVTVSHQVAGADYGSVTAADVEVTVTDNDTPGVRISDASLTLEEGTDANTYTVQLATEPSGDVTITPSSGDVNVVGVSGALTFNTGNWNTAQTVTLTGVEDDNVVDDTATVSHAVAGADYGSVNASDVEVTVTDNDEASVSVSVTTLTVTEGAEGTYTVQLVAQPSGDVTITPGSGDVNAATVSGALTFGTGTWNVPQTVTVAGAEDDDAVDETVTVSHAVAGANYGSVTVADVEVTVSDDDVAMVLVSTTALTVTEGTDTGTYTVQLATEPSGDVTVTPSSSDLTVLGVGAPLTFSSTNWNRAQTVSLTGVEDGNAVDDTATVSHAVAGADYNDVTAAGVEVTVTDTITPPGVTITPVALTVSEGGSGVYSAVLNAQPAPPGTQVSVTAAYAPGRSLDIELEERVLIFNEANWNVPQNYTVTAGQDFDYIADTATITHSYSGGGNYATPSPVASVVVTAVDSSAPTFGGAAVPDQFYTVDIGIPTLSLPRATVHDDTLVYTLTGDIPAELTFDADALTLTGMPTATVSAAELTYTVADSDDNTDAADQDVLTFAVSVLEPSLTVNPTALTVAEGGSEGYTVRLNSVPSGDVTVTPGSGDDDAATVSGALTFTTATWNVLQTVTVSGVDDDDAVDETVTVSHQLSGAAEYANATVSDVEVTVSDDESAAVSISVTALTVTEGAEGTYTVQLATQPSGDVTVTPGSGDDNVATVSGALTFTDGNWNTGQTVTVTGAEDDDAVDDTVTVSHAVSGADYGTVTADGVEVTVTDNDQASVSISVTALTVTEGGATGTV